jgi:hypothetical protein
MEQEENLYATLDDHDHDSISSENINNSFNKTTYMRNDEVSIAVSIFSRNHLSRFEYFGVLNWDSM